MTFGLWVVKLEAVVFMRGSGKTHIWAYFWDDCMICIWWCDSDRRFVFKFRYTSLMICYLEVRSDWWIDDGWQFFPQDVGKVVTECRRCVAKGTNLFVFWKRWFQLMVGCWLGLVVWIPGIPLWNGLLLGGTLRIPNHQPKPTTIH